MTVLASYASATGSIGILSLLALRRGVALKNVENVVSTSSSLFHADRPRVLFDFLFIFLLFYFIFPSSFFLQLSLCLSKRFIFLTTSENLLHLRIFIGM